MNRVLIFLTSAAALPLLADASVKAAALLVLAGTVALLMRRSSAAARHMVWLAAVVALLLVPVLAVVLPGWRVLPQWAVVDESYGKNETNENDVTAAEPLPLPAPPPAAIPLPAPAPEFTGLPSASPAHYSPSSLTSQPAALPAAPAPTPAPTSWLLPLWLTGCALLLLRLAAAHFLLRKNTRRSEPAAGPLAAAFAAAQQESGLRQPVRLLMDNARSIPVVWGLLRPTLLLPAEATTWDAAQLRSVLLHEFAHLRRRDPLVQFLTQIACALHWFNPLVWLAAWRLHVERERACDDMVLASGVRPSTYAGHLLHIATQLSPARWTQACGLAMARKSSLEGRLLAVLSNTLNRRGLTRAITAAAILLSAAIAVPIAMLRAQENEPAEKKSPSSEKPDAPPPTDRKSEKGTFSAADMELFDWEFGNIDYDPREKFDPEELTRLAKGPDESATDTEKSDHVRRLSWLIARAAAGKDASFKHLLNDASLKKEHSLLLALSGYDYALNGNRKALDYLLAELAKTRPGSDAQELIPLAFLDEWELTIAGYEKHFASGTDGAGGIAKGLFWAQRKCLFPQQFEAYLARKAGMTKLDPSTEAQLDWGEPANGLRGAIVIRPTAPGAEPGVFLAVQNVSDKPLRFTDTTAAEGLRKMYLSDTKGILLGLTSKEPTKTDAMLQPREVAYLRLLDPVASGEQSLEPNLIEGLRKDSLQTWRAVLDIQNAPDGAWKGKLTTGETRGAIITDSPQPKDPKAQALFKVWQNNARRNGDIPGGLVRLLHDKVQEFIRNNSGDASGDPYAKKMAPLEPRFDVAGDWKPADVVALMDDIAAVTTIPLEVTREHIKRTTLQRGRPLPAAYAKAGWGEPLEGGLRMAYVLEPQAAEYHLGTEVKARIVLHNSGDQPVAFVTSGFQQPGHKAKLAGGGELKLDSTFWTTLGRPEAYRLHPGEYCEIHTPGLGIGKRSKDRDDWSNVRAGSWILCDAGDEVVFTPGAALLARRDEQPDNDDWWLEFVTERLNREAPVPLDTKEREYLLYRVVRDLFGTAPSTTEGDAFAADKSPDALQNLAQLLMKHAWGKQSHGPIRAGHTTFKVLPPDTEAAKRVRVANNPGYYNLSDNLKFSVTRRAQGARIINEASLIHFQQGKDNAITKVELPDGYGTWAAALEPGTTKLYVAQKRKMQQRWGRQREGYTLRSYDFTDPAKIQERTFWVKSLADASSYYPGARAALSAIEAETQETTPPDPEGTAPKDNPPPAATEKKTSATDSTDESPEKTVVKQAKSAGTYELAKGVDLIIGERVKIRWSKARGAEQDAESLIDAGGAEPMPITWSKGSTHLWIMREEHLTWVDFSSPGSAKSELIEWHEAHAKVDHATRKAALASQSAEPANSQETRKAESPEAAPGTAANSLTLADLDRHLPKNDAGAYKLGITNVFYFAQDPPVRDLIAGKDVEVTGTLVRSGQDVTFHTMQTTCCSVCAFPIRISISPNVAQTAIRDFAIYRLSGKLEFLNGRNGWETRLVVSKIAEGPSPGTGAEPASPGENSPPAKKTADAAPSPDAVEMEKGRAAIKAGDRAAGREHFLKAVELNPNRGEAHFNLSVIYATDEPPDFAKAKEHYQQAIKLGTKPDEGMDKLLGR